MTKEEALKRIRRFYEEALEEFVGETDDYMALDMAIEALEKQIPKPIRRTTSTKRCSRCNRQLSWSMNTQISKRYCPRCGQAIDWEA